MDVYIFLICQKTLLLGYITFKFMIRCYIALKFSIQGQILPWLAFMSIYHYRAIFYNRIFSQIYMIMCRYSRVQEIFYCFFAYIFHIVFKCFSDFVWIESNAKFMQTNIEPNWEIIMDVTRSRLLEHFIKEIMMK